MKKAVIIATICLALVITILVISPSEDNTSKPVLNPQFILNKDKSTVYLCEDYSSSMDFIGGGLLYIDLIDMEAKNVSCLEGENVTLEVVSNNQIAISVESSDDSFHLVDTVSGNRISIYNITETITLAE